MAGRDGPRRWLGIDPNPLPNTDWLDAQARSAMARSYAEMPAEAWARLQPLSDGAPALAWLHSSRASVAAQRGWPRLADEEIRIAHSLAPRDLGIRIAVADSDQRRRHWDRAAEQAEDLALVTPENTALKRLQGEIGAHLRWELEVATGLRYEKSSAGNSPGSGVDFSSRLYSPPIGERWRAVAAAERSEASPVEGDVTRNRLGVGLQYRAPDVDLSLIGWNNTGTLNRQGVSGAIGWQPTDGWSLGAEAQRFADDTPLRALHYGIAANSVGASVGYDWNESAGVAASLRHLKFSDGNRRDSWRVAGLLRVIDTPRLDVVLRPEFHISSNTESSRPYFNPSRERAALMAATVEQRLSQVYERSLRHALTVAAGVYWQRDYGRDAIGSLRYEQRWRHDPLTELSYGSEVSRRVYDGRIENPWSLFANLRHRF
jgi:biofilm PGA synthesis protein PgaA